MKTVDHYKKAFDSFPECCLGAWSEKETLAELTWAVRHELDLWEENQDGCISDIEAQQCKKWLNTFSR